MEGNIDYKISANFTINDTYDLEVIDSNDIPVYTAIFMVCIEDAIRDSEKED